MQCRSAKFLSASQKPWKEFQLISRCYGWAECGSGNRFCRVSFSPKPNIRLIEIGASQDYQSKKGYLSNWRAYYALRERAYNVGLCHIGHFNKNIYIAHFTYLPKGCLHGCLTSLNKCN